ncbi:hypothetical protein FRC02_002480 [Tulasnella sp. 418]|nr:hypothetical protein FRC02_002480 [Tulasnella sp. 418]
MHRASNRSLRTSHRQNANKPTYSNSIAQHGFQSNHSVLHQGESRLRLSSFPAETLNWTTSFLLPRDLLTLALVNRHLNEHVNLESTWRSAFFSYFFGLDPTEDYYTHAGPLFRRSQHHSWKKEFVMRYNTISRWQEKSSNRTISHEPHHSNSAAIVYLPETSTLLSASLAYGVVARSTPFTGKVIKGFLDASGLLNGQGIGNPNAEFSPNVNEITLSASGSTAYVGWGFRNGDVAVTIAPKILASVGGRQNKFFKSKVIDSHLGRVSKIVFDTGTGSNVFASGGVDGKVKIWLTKGVQCLWTSELDSSMNGQQQLNDELNQCVQLAFRSNGLGVGTVAAAFGNGDVIVWTGFDLTATGHPNPASTPLNYTNKIRIPAQAPNSATVQATDPVSLSLHYNSEPDSEPIINLLMHSNNESRVHRFIIHQVEGGLTYDRIIYDDGPLGPLSCIRAGFISPAASIRAVPPQIKPTPITSPLGILASTLPVKKHIKKERSYVMAGDSLGRVTVWYLDGDDGTLDENGVKHVKGARRLEATDDGGGVSTIEVGTYVIVVGSTRGSISIWDAINLQHVRTIPLRQAGASGVQVDLGVQHIAIEGDSLIWSVGSRIIAWQAGGKLVSKKSSQKTGLQIVGQSGTSTRGKGVSKSQSMHEIKREVRDSRESMNRERKALQLSYKRAMAQQSTIDEMGLDETGAVEYLLMISRDEEEARLKNMMENLSLEDDEHGGPYSEGASSSPGSQETSPRSSAYWPTPGASPIISSFPDPSTSTSRLGVSRSFGSVAEDFPSISPPKTPQSSSPAKPSVWASPLSKAVIATSGTTSPTRIVRTQPETTRQEEADLMFAIELSLAEARSRGE